MGRLTEFHKNDVIAKNPCSAFTDIENTNDVRTDRQTTVLLCTRFTGLTTEYLAWLIITMEPAQVLEIVKDIYTESKGSRLPIEDVLNYGETIFLADSAETKAEKLFYYSMKKLSTFNHPRTEEQSKEFIRFIANMVTTLNTTSNKGEIQIIKDGLIAFDNKIV